SQKGILKNGKRWFPNPNGRYCGEVWHFPSERHVTKVNGKLQKLPHVTPKPLAIIERIIKASSNKGDLVLDCFMGSGTTAIAAQKLERNFIGADSDKTYVELAKQKVNQNKTTKSFIEQTLFEKGMDSAKYRISNSEFNAAIGIAQFPLED
ncbi:MAG: site-specific DNA-methyltransferase, partial [Planctomycetaceae bacterium]|nr:site-specific DNA-methyltransferase [Planctomycetaceae bacterium]